MLIMMVMTGLDWHCRRRLGEVCGDIDCDDYDEYNYDDYDLL